MQNDPLAPQNGIDPANLNILEQRVQPQDARERTWFVIARNAIPVIGVLFLGWSAINLILLYFLDTLGSMWALMAALLTQFFGGWTTLPWQTRLSNLFWVIALSLFLIGFFSIPLGMPVFILLMMQHWDWRATLNDQGFMFGLVSIVLLSLIGMLRHAFRFHRAPADDKWTRRTFGLLFLRWVVMIVLIFTFAGLLLGFAPIAIVIAYAALTVITELYPDRFLAAFGSSLTHSSQPYAPPPSASDQPTPTQRARWERKRRKHKK